MITSCTYMSRNVWSSHAVKRCTLHCLGFISVFVFYLNFIAGICVRKLISLWRSRAISSMLKLWLVQDPVAFIYLLSPRDILFSVCLFVCLSANFL